jgi:hypothetical protein
MRAIFVAAAFALSASAGFAQTPSSGTATPPVAASPSAGVVDTPPSAGGSPEVGGPLFPATDAGLDKVASDGISTRTVRAAPCSKAARETDGTTTCIGIPGPISTTTGRSRQ